MVVATPGSTPPATETDGMLTRVVQRRWLLAAVAVACVGIALVGGATLAAAAVLFVALVIAVVALPLPPALAGDQVVAAASPAPLGTTAAIGRFADALPDPCFILDRRGVVLYANARAIGTFSIRAGDAITFRLRVPDVLAAFDRVAKGGPPERVEFSERVPTERWFAAWFAPLEPASTAAAARSC